MPLFGILYNIYNIYIDKKNFCHIDFKQKRTYNATSINAIYNNFICYTLSISSTRSHLPNHLHQPDHVHLDPFSCMRHNYSGQYICHSMK